MDMRVLNWLHGEPSANGKMKTTPEDFRVTEDLGYRPDGDGEHLLVRLRKQGCNTRFVANALAEFAGIPVREVSFAGMKDRHAVTVQWFCLRMAGRQTPDMSLFTLDGCEIMESARHKRKLRIGGLKGNHFQVILRKISDSAVVEQRLLLVSQQGVPNYVGLQRFGHHENNLLEARRWAANEMPVRERSRRSFLLSAARSALFNQVVSKRLTQYHSLCRVLAGDVLQLAGRGSSFVAVADELEILQQRINQQELCITAPLAGRGASRSRDAALAFEQECLADEAILAGLPGREGVDAARRAMMVYPRDFLWNWHDKTTVELRFWLPVGSFATSVIREIINAEKDNTDIIE